MAKRKELYKTKVEFKTIFDAKTFMNRMAGRKTSSTVIKSGGVVYRRKGKIVRWVGARL